MGKNYQYDAFISYRHTPLDKDVATKLHRMLESYVIPKQIGGKRRKLSRVFRDQEELPTSSDLASNIAQALENSEFLIVICSPDTPQSKWVEKEIETFMKCHGSEKVLALLVEGEPKEAFPPALLRKEVIKQDEKGNPYSVFEDVEPLAADIRGQSERQRNKLLRQEVIRIMAALLGCPYDDLRQRHKERKKRQLVGSVATIGLILVLFGTISTWQAISLKQQVDKTLTLQSRYFSDTVLDLVAAGDRGLGAYIALGALPADLQHPNRPYVPEAEYALNEALYTYKLNDRFVGDKVLEHGSKVKHMTVSEDGKYVLSEDGSALLTLWDTASGKRLWQRSVGEDNDNESGFLLEKDVLVREGMSLKRLDLLSQSVKWEVVLNGDNLDIKLADNKKLALVYDGTALDVITMEDGGIHYSVPMSTLMMTAMAISPDNRYAAVVTMEGQLMLLNLETKQMKSWNVVEGMATDLDFNSAGNKLVCARTTVSQNNILDEEGKVFIYDLEGRELWRQEILQWGYDQVQFSPDDPDVLALVSDNYIEVLNVASGDRINDYVVGADVKDLVWKGNMLAAGCVDGKVRFYLIGHTTEVDSAQISDSDPIDQLEIRKGMIVLANQHSQQIKVYTPIIDERYEVVGKTALGKDYLIYGKLSDSGDWGVIYNQNHQVELWDMRNKKLKQTYTFDASEGAVKTIAFKGETLMIITDSMVVKSIEPQTLVTKEIRRNPSDVFEMKWSSDDSKLLIVGANRFEVIDAVTLQKSWEQEGIPVPSNTAVNSKGEVIALTEEGVMHYQHDGAFKLDEGTFESGIIGEKYIVLWHKHGMTIYEGNEKIQEIPWQGKEIENVLLIPGKEDIIVQSNDDKAYVINTQTAQIRRQIPLEDNMMGNLIGCHQVAADQSIVIEGEWYTLKVSAVDYKVLWKSDQILDVSDGGKGVLVRDERGGFEDQVVRYPYFDTQRTMDEAKKILNQYWIDEGRKAAYYVE